MARDVKFNVEYVHRLRFTHDVFDPRNVVLADVFTPPSPGARLLAFVDSGLAKVQPDLVRRLENYLAAVGAKVPPLAGVYLIPGGEQAKNDASVGEAVLERIHQARLCRHSYVLVLGGGAVLDTVGFAAAIAHRGLRLVRLPSTTLAQADSGVGVKNGINAFGKKNFLGVFAVPWAVVNDLNLLDTLSPRDWRSGLAEIVKVALIRDVVLFQQVRDAAPRLRQRDMAAAAGLIERSARLHLEHIVQGDPFERGTGRPLDFGHWAAHKLETMTQHRLRHGEAVAIGMALDMQYAVLAGLLEPSWASAIHVTLSQLGLPLYDSAMADADRLLEGLEEFREHLGGAAGITLPCPPGHALEITAIDPGLMIKAMTAMALWAGCGCNNTQER